MAPSAREYCPATQLVHTASPVAILYLPATHALQLPSSSRMYPELHVQSSCSPFADAEAEFVAQAWHTFVIEPAGEYFPSAQSVHEALPGGMLYLPSKHNEHSRAGPVDPTRHTNKHGPSSEAT